MKQWRGEKGSALVMVMFMMLILTLLGVAVLSAAVGGARQTLTRENDIQSLQLTQKVLDESVASIAAQINAKTANPDFKEINLKDALNEITNSLDPAINKAGVKTENLANASGKLLAKPEVKADLASKVVNNGVDIFTAYTITLRAGATVNGVERTLTQQVKVNMYPDFLNYAFGSENNLILNGTPLIKGNIYAGNMLQVSQIAKYRYKNNWLTQDSIFPKMKIGSSGQLPQAYVQSLDQFVVSKSGGPYTSVNSSRNGTETDKRVKEALNIPLEQVKVKNNQKFIKIDVDQSVIDKLAEALGKSRKDVADNYGDLAGYLDKQTGIKIALPVEPPKPKLLEEGPPSIPSVTASDDVQKAYLSALKTYNDVKKGYEDALAKYQSELLSVKTKLSTMDSTVIYDDPAHGSTLTLDGGLLSDLGTAGNKAGKWLIVKGDLIVNNTVSNTPLKIASNLLVTGNVTLAGPIDVDSTLFTLGKTTIQDASIHGIKDSGEEKEIVLISKGEILLNRVDKFKNTADSLRGFFYTDSTAELYGVGTNFKLQGGFFAKGDLTVNAVFGDSKEGDSRIQVVPQIDPGDSVENSRFQVDYNNQVFEHQGISLPHVPQVSVTAGKIQLDSVTRR